MLASMMVLMSEGLQCCPLKTVAEAAGDLLFQDNCSFFRTFDFFFLFLWLENCCAFTRFFQDLREACLVIMYFFFYQLTKRAALMSINRPR